MSDKPSAEGESIPDSVKNRNAGTKIHVINVEGADERTLDEMTKELDGADDNIIVTNAMVEPMTKGEFREILFDLAEAADINLS